jgi:hypothetical protein
MSTTKTKEKRQNNKKPHKFVKKYAYFSKNAPKSRKIMQLKTKFMCMKTTFSKEKSQKIKFLAK